MITKEQKYFQVYKSASRRNKEFNLSLRTVENLLAQTHCAYTGKPFVETNMDERLSFERIDNSIGYVDGNVIPVQEIYNKARGNLSLDEFVESTLKTSVNKVKSSNQEIQLERHYAKLKRLTDLLEELNNKPSLDDSQKLCQTKWTKDINIKLTEIQNLKAAISKTCGITPKVSIRLEKYKNSILRFKNLSCLDQLKVKYGLSLDTSVLGLLKEIYVRIRINL